MMNPQTRSWQTYQLLYFLSCRFEPSSIKCLMENKIYILEEYFEITTGLRRRLRTMAWYPLSPIQSRKSAHRKAITIKKSSWIANNLAWISKSTLKNPQYSPERNRQHYSSSWKIPPPPHPIHLFPILTRKKPANINFESPPQWRCAPPTNSLLLLAA